MTSMCGHEEEFRFTFKIKAPAQSCSVCGDARMQRPLVLDTRTSFCQSPDWRVTLTVITLISYRFLYVGYERTNVLIVLM